MAKRRLRKPLVWLNSEIKTPPFSEDARGEAGNLLRRLQDGESFGLPYSRPMPVVGPRCHELRIRDLNRNWRIVYRIDKDVIIVVLVFPKTAQATSMKDIRACKSRLSDYDRSRRT
jgi:phage-related protein